MCRESGIWCGAGVHRVGNPPGRCREAPLDCAHLFGLAEVGDVQGVDATGADPRPAHLGTVLELLLLPRGHGWGRGDSENTETLTALPGFAALPSPFGCLCTHGLFFFFLLCHLLRAGPGSCATRAAASLTLGVCHGWEWHRAEEPPLGAPSCSLIAMNGSFSSERRSCPWQGAGLR